MSEDLPNPESRVTVDGGANPARLAAQQLGGASERWWPRFKERLRAAGYPIVLTKPFDRRTPSHQCGTVRMGDDPATVAARSVLPRLRSSQSVRRRRLLAADLGGGQSVADGRRAGACASPITSRSTRSLSRNDFHGLRLHHRRRRLRRLRARQPAERRPVDQGAAAGGRRRRLRTCCSGCRPASPR